MKKELELPIKNICDCCNYNKYVTKRGQLVRNKKCLNCQNYHFGDYCLVIQDASKLKLQYAKLKLHLERYRKLRSYHDFDRAEEVAREIIDLTDELLDTLSGSK